MSPTTRARHHRPITSLVTLLALGAAAVPGVVGCDADGNFIGNAGEQTPAAPEDVEVTSAAVSTTATSYFLVLDGTLVGPVKSFSGGNATAPVLTETVGTSGVPNKHLGAVSYEDIAFDIDSGTAAVFWQWVSATLARNFVRHNGSIVSLDVNLKEVERMNFFDAGISEIGFPGADPAVKTSAPLKIKLRPSTTQVVAGSGAAAPAMPAAKSALIESNFQLSISGLTTTKVVRMPPFVVTIAVPPLGSATRWVETIPNLSFSVAGVVTDWNAWAQDFIVHANNGPTAEKTGTLRYLAADLKTPILTLNFTGLGIFRTSADPASPAGTNRLLAELYAEDARLSSLPPQ
jgi:hypothetical protein